MAAMTTDSPVAGPHPPRAHTRRLVGPVVVLLGGVMSLVTVLVLTLLDRVRITRPEELASEVGFGLPFDWVAQQQYSLDPPLPYSASLRSPWEHVTSAQLVPFVVDVVLVWLAVVVAWVLLRGLLSRRGAAVS